MLWFACDLAVVGFQTLWPLLPLALTHRYLKLTLLPQFPQLPNQRLTQTPPRPLPRCQCLRLLPPFQIWTCLEVSQDVSEFKCEWRTGVVHRLCCLHHKHLIGSSLSRKPSHCFIAGKKCDMRICDLVRFRMILTHKIWKLNNQYVFLVTQ